MVDPNICVIDKISTTEKTEQSNSHKNIQETMCTLTEQVIDNNITNVSLIYKTPTLQETHTNQLAEEYCSTSKRKQLNLSLILSLVEKKLKEKEMVIMEKEMVIKSLREQNKRLFKKVETSYKLLAKFKNKNLIATDTTKTLLVYEKMAEL